MYYFFLKCNSWNWRLVNYCLWEINTTPNYVIFKKKGFDQSRTSAKTYYNLPEYGSGQVFGNISKMPWDSEYKSGVYWFCLVAWQPEPMGDVGLQIPSNLQELFDRLSASYAAVIWLNPSRVYTMIISLDYMPLKVPTFWLKKGTYWEK